MIHLQILTLANTCMFPFYMNLQNSKGIQFCVNVAVITAHAYHLTVALLLNKKHGYVNNYELFAFSQP